MKFEGRIAVSAMMLLFFAIPVAMAFTFPAEARVLPLVVGIPGIALGLIQLVSELRKPSEIGSIGPGEQEQLRRELGIFAWLAFFVAAILLFGFVYAGPVVLALYLRLSWKESWLTVALSATLLWAILHFIFNTWLGLVLFRGFLVP